MSAVLAGLDESPMFDSLDCHEYIGTSAGSIVAASLVAGIAPGSRLGEIPAQPPLSAQESAQAAGMNAAFETALGIGSAAAAPLVSLALSSSATGGALLRRAILRKVPAGDRSLAQLGRAIELAGPRWDGRLRVAAVDLESGSRVIFGADGQPEPPVSLAVQASCAIPGVFEPVRFDGRSYVDGGVWSPTNMDTAEATRGESLLCLNPTGSLRPTIGALAGAMGPVSRGVATAEALALKHRGVHVTTISPDAASSAAIGPNLMDPGRREQVIAAGLAQGRLLASSEAA
jgi:NTE family protein